MMSKTEALAHVVVKCTRAICKTILAAEMIKRSSYNQGLEDVKKADHAIKEAFEGYVNKMFEETKL